MVNRWVIGAGEGKIISYALRDGTMTNSEITDKMNIALGWELRAINMYAHYAAYIRGIHRLQLEPHFTAEANESMANTYGSLCKSLRPGYSRLIT